MQAKLVMQAKPAAQTKAARKANAVVEEEEDLPEDIDAFRYALARKILRIVSDRKARWRKCSERLCQRTRACHAPHGACGALKELPPMSPERQARSLARIQRALKKRMDEIDAERERESADKSHKKS